MRSRICLKHFCGIEVQRSFASLSMASFFGRSFSRMTSVVPGYDRFR